MTSVNMTDLRYDNVAIFLVIVAAGQYVISDQFNNRMYLMSYV